MAQVTIYLDSESEKKARLAARAEGVSLSKWVTRRIRANAHAQWPESVRKLAGAWSDLPTAEEIRHSKAKDLRRERL